MQKKYPENRKKIKQNNICRRRVSALPYGFYSKLIFYISEKSGHSAKNVLIFLTVCTVFLNIKLTERFYIILIRRLVCENLRPYSVCYGIRVTGCDYNRKITAVLMNIFCIFHQKPYTSVRCFCSYHIIRRTAQRFVVGPVEHE